MNIQASPAVEDKKVGLAGVKVKKEPMLAADHGDNDKSEEGVTADSVDPTRPFEDQNLGLARFPEVWLTSSRHLFFYFYTFS